MLLKSLFHSPIGDIGLLADEENILSLSFINQTFEDLEAKKSDERFKDMIDKKDFLEWAQFAGNYYGTPLSTVNEKIEKGFIVLLEIEVEGAKQIKEKFPEALSIFLLPPSKAELEKRIRNRGTEKEEAIDRRLSRADYEIASSGEFDFVLTNHDVDETVKGVFKIIES